MPRFTRKIAVEELRVGMYVEALDRPWLKTDYLLEGVEVRSRDDIERLSGLCEHVYISTIGEESTSPTAEQAIARDVIPPPGQRTPHRFRDELPIARAIHGNARHLVRSIHDDVRGDNTIDTGAVGEAVEQMMDSVARHPDALLWFSNLKNRDEYTAEHSLNVCMLAVTLASFVGESESAIKEMGIGALLHDVGKIKVPLAILNKPGRLTDAEFETMKQHPQFGVEILSDSPDLSRASIEVVRDHHERLNGRGYPAGRRAGEISRYTQIVSIADVYDAITSDRVYQKGRSPASAIDVMRASEGEFNDDLLHGFADYLGGYPVGSLVELNTGEVGFVMPTPERRDKPTVLLVLDYKKRRYYPQHLRDLTQFPNFTVKRMLAPGTYGVDVDDYAQNPSD